MWEAYFFRDTLWRKKKAPQKEIRKSVRGGRFGRFLICMYIYGKNPIREALSQAKHTVSRLFVSRRRGGRDIEEIVRLALSLGIGVKEVPDRVLKDLVGNQNHQGVVAEVEFVYEPLDNLFDYPAVLVLDHIQDPHNLGALARSAAAFGVKGIVIAQNRAVHVTPAVVKVSEGNIFKVDVSIVINLRRAIEEFKKRGFWVYGADMGGRSIWDVSFAERVLLLLGSEGKGISRLMRESCDEVVAIPMEPKVESLNVSVSGAILMLSLIHI